MTDFPEKPTTEGNFQDLQNQIGGLLIITDIEPREPKTGQLWFSPGLSTLKIWNGTTYKTITLT